METITGNRTNDGVRVCIDQFKLDPDRSQQVVNHSPDGFEWGYGGSGPAQLALAILLEFTDEETARRLYQKFKWNVIAGLSHDSFILPAYVVEEFIRKEKESE